MFPGLHDEKHDGLIYTEVLKTKTHTPQMNPHGLGSWCIFGDGSVYETLKLNWIDRRN